MPVLPVLPACVCACQRAGRRSDGRPGGRAALRQFHPSVPMHSRALHTFVCMRTHRYVCMPAFFVSLSCMCRDHRRSACVHVHACTCMNVRVRVRPMMAARETPIEYERARRYAHTMLVRVPMSCMRSCESCLDRLAILYDRVGPLWQLIRATYELVFEARRRRQCHRSPSIIVARTGTLYELGEGLVLVTRSGLVNARRMPKERAEEHARHARHSQTTEPTA